MLPELPIQRCMHWTMFFCQIQVFSMAHGSWCLNNWCFGHGRSLHHALHPQGLMADMKAVVYLVIPEHVSSVIDQPQG